MGRAHDGIDTERTVDSFGGEIGRGRARTIRARWELQTVTGVREAIAPDLTARGVSDEIVSEAELVATELVTNSLRHAAPLSDRTVRIHWKARGDSVEIEVSDGGAETEPAPAPRQCGRPPAVGCGSCAASPTSGACSATSGRRPCGPRWAARPAVGSVHDVPGRAPEPPTHLSTARPR
uniref:ATP-binding protein n=1 Tax=Janibacter limosus TaxID=53458 RepID=A0AC61U4G5_9MICO|nr:ATP-binding protein [Janibacter limosus]